MNAAATTTSPGRKPMRSSKVAMDDSQRVRSPARPFTSFSARSSFTSRSASSSSSACLFACDSLCCSFSASSLDFTSASWPSATACACCIFATLSWAALSAARLGATSFDTLPYTYMACTHMHIPPAGPATLPIASGLKSGLSVYFLILLSSASTSLSLSKPVSFSRKPASPICFFASSQDVGRCSTVMTPFMHSSTAAGGLLYALSSEMSFFEMTLSALAAASSAGMAFVRPASQSAWIVLASATSLPIFVASAFTIFSCSSATRLSCTIVTSSSSQLVLALATTTFFSLHTSCISATCTLVSASLSRPPRSLLALLPRNLRFSLSRRR
mmetsp:Transcript_18336/g.62339  ORF Transcript_18336/g.62339 Transcript_18336/m.62339 type:complete len:330 (+) Transcript_18336:3505-4494(+)